MLHGRFDHTSLQVAVNEMIIGLINNILIFSCIVLCGHLNEVLAWWDHSSAEKVRIDKGCY